MPDKRDHASVIGAGTAGLIAARRLAELGVGVSVYEQKRLPGRPVHASGIVSRTGLQSLGVDYSGAVTNTLHGARIHAGKSSLSAYSREVMAHVVDRERLNDVCHDEAVSAGAEVILERRIYGSGLASLSESSMIVGADGAVSSVARHFSMGSIPEYCVTYKADYEISAENADVVDIFLNNGISKGLFGWVCPNSKEVIEVGVGLSHNHGNAKKAFERLISLPSIANIVSGKRPVSEGASIIPMGLRGRIADRAHGVLLVGDAAGQVKPSTGGGIVFGGNAALLAAEGIRKEIDGKDGIGWYEKEYWRRYFLDTRLHVLIRWVYSNMGPGGLESMLGLMEYVGVGSLLGRYGEMDMPSRIIGNSIRGLADAVYNAL